VVSVIRNEAAPQSVSMLHPIHPSLTGHVISWTESKTSLKAL